jgi:transposase
VYKDMEQWTEIRRRVLIGGTSKRQILRETGMHWTTLEKILSHSEPPGYRRSSLPLRPKIGPFLARIGQILEQDRVVPRKQRHTAKRIFERLRDEEGYTGGYTQVKEAVSEIKSTNAEVFMPLVHRPGEAQADFGWALVKHAGVLRKVPYFVMALPHSDALFVQVFERITTETLWEGHLRAFAFFGGVPWRITYDNDRVLVAKIIGRDRRLTRGFLQLQSHFLFDSHFCRVRRANEKGVVEGTVRYARLNFLVPVPEVRDLDELNARLVEACRSDLRRRLRGKGAPKETLLVGDREKFLPLPEAPFDACRKTSTTASSLSLVRFDTNDYSVPVRWAHHPVVVKGYVDRVVICHRAEVIAEHRRLWSREGVSFDPVHYLALLERKPGALDHARPLEGWDLPACLGVLRRRLEAQDGGEGTREYIRVLRLLEKHSLPALRRAVERGLRVSALSRDAVAQFLVPREAWRATSFRLDGREHLRLVRVETTDVRAYADLLVEAAP